MIYMHEEFSNDTQRPRELETFKGYSDGSIRAFRHGWIIKARARSIRGFSTWPVLNSEVIMGRIRDVRMLEFLSVTKVPTYLT